MERSEQSNHTKTNKRTALKSIIKEEEEKEEEEKLGNDVLTALEFERDFPSFTIYGHSTSLWRHSLALKNGSV